jgi:hypothetical protein
VTACAQAFWPRYENSKADSLDDNMEVAIVCGMVTGIAAGLTSTISKIFGCLTGFKDEKDFIDKIDKFISKCKNKKILYKKTTSCPTCKKVIASLEKYICAVTEVARLHENKQLAISSMKVTHAQPALSSISKNGFAAKNFPAIIASNIAGNPWYTRDMKSLDESTKVLNRIIQSSNLMVVDRRRSNSSKPNERKQRRICAVCHE